MTPLVRSWGSLTFFLVGAVLLTHAVQMKQEQCAAYLQNPGLNGGVFLVGVSLLLFVISVGSAFSELMKRRRRK
jgi:hypothetical protein